MKIPLILLDLSTLMLPGSSVEASGLRWTMGRVGWLTSRTPGGAELEISFDVGVAEDTAVVVVIDDVLIGGFDTTGEVQDTRLRAILEGTLPSLAGHAAELRREAAASKQRRSEKDRARQRSALDHL